MELRHYMNLVLTALVLLLTITKSLCQEEFLDWSNANFFKNSNNETTHEPLENIEGERTTQTGTYDENLYPIPEEKTDNEYNNSDTDINTDPLNQWLLHDKLHDTTLFELPDQKIDEIDAHVQNSDKVMDSEIYRLDDSNINAFIGDIDNEGSDISANENLSNSKIALVPSGDGSKQTKDIDNNKNESTFMEGTIYANSNDNVNEYSDVIDKESTSTVTFNTEQENIVIETTSSISSRDLIDDGEDYAYIEEVLDDDNELRCPNECVCEDTTHSDNPVGIKVDCTEQALTNVPEGIDEKVNELYLRDNDISIVLAEFSLGFPDLKKVCFKDNKVSVIEIGAFHGSPELNFVCLGNNKLTEFPKELETQVNLQTLNLRGNPISEKTPITTSNFENMAKLEKLFLPENTDVSIVNDLCKSHFTLNTVAIGDEDYLCANVTEQKTFTGTMLETSLNKLVSTSNETELEEENVNESLDKKVVNKQVAEDTQIGITFFEKLNNAKSGPNFFEDLKKQNEEITADTKYPLEVISTRLDEKFNSAEDLLTKTLSNVYLATDLTLTKFLNETEDTLKSVKEETFGKLKESTDSVSKAGEQSTNDEENIDTAQENNNNVNIINRSRASPLGLNIPVGPDDTLEKIQPTDMEAPLLPSVNADFDKDNPPQLRGKFDSDDKPDGKKEKYQKNKVLEKKTEEITMLNEEKNKAKMSEVHTAGGTDYIVFGLIVGFMVFVVVGITLKKNWGSLKRRFGGRPPPPRSPTALSPNGLGPHTPEETAPLRSGNQSPA